MFSATEDDDFFNPTSSSHLASLFGTSMALKPDGDTSLVYTAPKQPKTGTQDSPKSTPKPATQSSVVCSKFVDVFKLIDKSHTDQGKCGLAIIGSQTLKSYEIILYKSKQEIITRSKLKSDFIFTIQSNNFAYFCDDQKQRWSVHFENPKEIDEFVHNLENFGGKIAHDNKNVDSSNTSTNEGGTKTEPTLPNIASTEKDKDSDSTSDNSSNQTKASILSRMAKMGQSILPTNLQKTSSEHSDSETDEHTQNKKQIKKRQKFVTNNGDCVPTDKVTHANNIQSLNVHAPTVPDFVIINGQLVQASALQQPLPPPFPIQYNIQSIPNQHMLNQPQAMPMSDSLHVFIAENRTHNCEMRMNVSQLSSKLDNVLSRLDKNDHTSSNDDSKIRELELKIVEKVKELEESMKIISNLREQQSTLHESIVSNQSSIDNLKKENEVQQKMILEEKQKVAQLEKDKLLLEIQVTQNMSLQQNFDRAQQKIGELKRTIDKHNFTINLLENRARIISETISEGENEQSIEIEDLNKYITLLKSRLADKNSKADLFAKKFKQSMNLLYQEIMENFEGQNVEFPSAHIKQILSQEFKTATLSLIQEFQNDFKTNMTPPGPPF